MNSPAVGKQLVHLQLLPYLFRLVTVLSLLVAVLVATFILFVKLYIFIVHYFIVKILLSIFPL